MFSLSLKGESIKKLKSFLKGDKRILFILGAPIAFSLGTAGIVGILLITGDLRVLMSMVGLVTFDAVSSYVLSAVPYKERKKRSGESRNGCD